MNDKKKRRVSYATRDAWKVKPPCELVEKPYCHEDCPWWGECSL